jgi:hypothetical protein
MHAWMDLEMSGWVEKWVERRMSRWGEVNRWVMVGSHRYVLQQVFLDDEE